MERIDSLRREKKRRSLDKLKIDINNTPLANLQKIVAYMSKDLKNINLIETDLEEYLKFSNFNFEVEKVWNSSIKSRVGRVVKSDLSDIPVYEIKLTELGNKFNEIYVPVSTKVSKRTLKYLYAIPTSVDRKMVLELELVYGCLKTLDSVYEEVISKKDFYLSEEFKNISLFNLNYSEKEVDEILHFAAKTNLTLYPIRYSKKEDFKLYSKILKFLIDVIVVMKDIDCNIALTNKYNADTNSECARAFETKKNIPDKILRVMNTSKFLNDFSYIEIDEETDISKFRIIEKEWTSVKKALNLSEALKDIKPELRFRKLGKHRALGLYYPGLRCICVDTSSPSSFIHEMGHFIDYTNKVGQLSLRLEFFPLISEYKIAYKDYINNNKSNENINYLIRKESYFFTPTEIFARLLEIYLIDKGVKTSFLKEKSQLTMDTGYPVINDFFMNLIRNYFDKLITVNLEDLDKREKVINDISQRNKELKVNYVEPVLSSDGQLKFAI